MTKASDNKYPKLLLDFNSVSPSAPGDASWKVYAKANGIFARSSNTEVGPFASSGGSGTNLNPGTSFPGSPATNDLCFRTDRGILYYYDGTRWLSLQVYEIPLYPEDNKTWPPTATTLPLHRGSNLWSGYDLYLLSWQNVSMVLTTNNGTNYWTANLRKYDSAGGGDTIIATYNTSGDTANTVYNKSTSINALLGSYVAFYTDVATTLSPGSYRVHGGVILCRLVG